jgi:hypothetical protein
MTKKQAYCCLNCTNSAGCSAVAGQCPSCCADCGDTSGCITTAYFGKDDQIYKGYIATSAGSSEWSSIGEYYVANGRATYNSITDSLEESSMSRFITTLCGECLCGEGIGVSYNDNTTICSGKICTTTMEGKGNCQDCNGDPPCGPNTFGGGCQCEDVYRSTSTSSPSYFSPRDVTGPACDGAVPEGVSLTITFIVPLRTYNYLGEIVANPTPGSPYNPCQPLRSASPPACCFFA